MILDLLLLAVVASGAFYGYNNGIMRALLFSGAAIVGLIFILRFTPEMARILYSVMRVKSQMLPVMAVMVNLGLLYVGFRYLNYVSNGWLAAQKPTESTRLVSAAMLGGAAAYLFSSVVMFFDKADAIPESIRRECNTLPTMFAIQATGTRILESVLPAFRGLTGSAEDIFKLREVVSPEDDTEDNGATEPVESEPAPSNSEIVNTPERVRVEVRTEPVVVPKNRKPTRRELDSIWARKTAQWNREVFKTK